MNNLPDSVQCHCHEHDEGTSSGYNRVHPEIFRSILCKYMYIASSSSNKDSVTADDW